MKILSVHSSKIFEESGRYHWRLYGPSPMPSGAVREIEDCCHSPKVTGFCLGFGSKKDAGDDVRERMTELERAFASGLSNAAC